MTTNQQEENREVVRSIDRAVSTGDLDAIDDLVAEDYVEHNPDSPSDRRGPAALKGFVEPFLAAFADFELVEDDYGHSTHWRRDGSRGDRNLPHRGRESNEKWTVGDTLGLIRQLGAVPESPAV